MITPKDKEKSDSVRDIEDTGKFMATSGGMQESSTKTRSVARRDHSKDGDKTPRRDMEALVRPLVVATSLAATSFVVSAALFLRRRRR